MDFNDKLDDVRPEYQDIRQDSCRAREDWDLDHCHFVYGSASYKYLENRLETLLGESTESGKDAFVLDPPSCSMGLSNQSSVWVPTGVQGSPTEIRSLSPLSTKTSHRRSFLVENLYHWGFTCIIYFQPNFGTLYMLVLLYSYQFCL